MNLENSNIKCFIIHLKRAHKRKSFVDDIIKNVPIDSEIINAVDGKYYLKKISIIFYLITRFITQNILLRLILVRLDVF